jgi:hypothetical protein
MVIRCWRKFTSHTDSGSSLKNYTNICCHHTFQDPQPESPIRWNFSKINLNSWYGIDATFNIVIVTIENEQHSFAAPSS